MSMARLNEQPIIGESVEALKRRFIRQNRELARTNSTQSIRIRNLEAETSRLLSENITLREENIQLRRDAEGRHEKRALGNVTEVKGKLEAKLAELNDLVVQLGKAKDPPPGPTPRRRTSRRSFQRSPDLSRWKAVPAICDGSDGRLPAIVEDKYYPRRTLDTEELRILLPDETNITDSPDLGPPPVAHFDDGDPVKYDKSPLIESGNAAEESDLPGDLAFANLETRRKRKDNNAPKESLQSEKLNDQNQRSAASSSQILKQGAKRKLSTRDDGDGISAVSSDTNPFSFVRRSETQSVPEETSRHPAAGNKSTAASRNKGKDGAPSRGASRKALGEKDVNTDPVNSPVKNRPALAEKAADVYEEPVKKPRDRTRGKEPPASFKPVRIESTLDPKKATTSTETALETPAPPNLDLFSPADGGPSTARPQSRDTSPPEDLNSDSQAAGGRPSRRQRSAVSYAEPNLRDKMRRPTKELADAVTTDKAVRGTSVRAESAEYKEKPPSTVKVKKEEPNAEHTSDWKSLPVERTSKGAEPTSPLGNKPSNMAPIAAVDSDAELPRTVLTDRRRRSSALHALPSHALPRSASANAGTASSETIAALVAGGQRRMSRAREAAEARARGETEDVSQFDNSVDDQSAIGGRVGTREGAGTREGRAALGANRRHSSMSDMRKVGLGGRMTVELGKRKETLAGKNDNEDRLATTDNGGQNAGTIGRAERAAMRRRSMVI